MRAFWVVFGVAAHALLIVTVWYLFPFLQGGANAAAAVDGWTFLGRDVLLAAQFGVLHSVLLLPRVRGRLERVVPSPLYGCVFAATTCASLLLVIFAWQPGTVVLWRLEGTAATAIRAAYLLSWAGLIYGLCLSGVGYQTGWTPWWAWLRSGSRHGAASR